MTGPHGLTGAGDPASLVAAVAGRRAGDRALSGDGRHWYTVGDLLDRAAALARALGPGRAVPVPVADPVEAVATLLAAQGAGRTAVLAAPSWPAAGPAHVLASAGAPPARPELPGAVDSGAAIVVVTSGSTGSPRAIVRMPASWTASLPGVDDLLGPQCPPGEVVWTPGGLDATLTLFGIWHGLATGRPVVASGRWRGPGGAAVGQEAAAVHCVPAVLGDLLAARRAGGLPRLRRAVVAGSALPRALREAAEAAGVHVAEYYGAAELSFIAADPDGEGLRPFPGVELAVRDGIIWSRSPYHAIGYLDGSSRGPLRRDGEGWASVGDRGTLVDGILTVSGRGTDVASVGGRVVVLDDVERVLADAAGVAEALCFAAPDPLLGQHVLAVVRPDGRLGEESAGERGRGDDALVARLREVARAGLPAPARPIRYVVRTHLPRTAGGKAARAALRADLGLP